MASKNSYYPINGKLYPRVTSINNMIAKPFLVPWAAKMERELVINAAVALYEDLASKPAVSSAQYSLSLESRIGKEKAHKKEIDKAMVIGSEAHARCQWFLQKQLGIILPEPQVSEKALWASMAAEDFIKQTGFQAIHVEQTVHSAKYGYAGTADFFGLIDNELILGDFKTGKALYPEYNLQVAAYVYAFEEMGHGRATKAVLLRLPKVTTDPGFEAVWLDREEIDRSFQAFLGALTLWNHFNPLPQKKETMNANTGNRVERNEPNLQKDDTREQAKQAASGSVTAASPA